MGLGRPGQLLLLQDAPQQPGRCHGAAPVDGDPEAAMPVVVYHLGRGEGISAGKAVLEPLGLKAARSRCGAQKYPYWLQADPRGVPREALLLLVHPNPDPPRRPSACPQPADAHTFPGAASALQHGSAALRSLPPSRSCCPPERSGAARRRGARSTRCWCLRSACSCREK